MNNQTAPFVDPFRWAVVLQLDRKAKGNIKRNNSWPPKISEKQLKKKNIKD